MFALQNWYCAGRSEDFGDTVVARRIVKQDIAFFRDSAGNLHALGATCPHRGGNLSLGRQVDDTLECPWHGWRYGADGRCRLIPSLGEAGRIPNGARVPSYPIHEAQGVAYVWMAPDVAPAWQPPQHDFLDARYHVKSPGRVQRGNYVSTVEAACDDSHVYITHRNTIGAGARAQLPPIVDVRTVEDGRAVEGDMRWPPEQKKRQSGFGRWYNRKLIGVTENPDTHDKTFRVELTGLVIHRYVKSDGSSFIVYAFTTPVDELSNWFHAGVVDTAAKRPLVGNLIYLLTARSLGAKVFDEDEAMITSALTNELPGGHPRPISVNADAIGLGFRRIYANQVSAEGYVPAWPAAGDPVRRLGDAAPTAAESAG